MGHVHGYISPPSPPAGRAGPGGQAAGQLTGSLNFICIDIGIGIS